MSTDAQKVALVTGGSRGIGLGIAKELARCGYRVAINGRRPAADVGDSLAAIEELGGQPIYCQADIGNLDEHEQLLHEIKEQAGQLNVLVNNAGVAPNVRADLLEADAESFDRLIGINLRGPYFLTQRVARWMIDQQQANEVFQASIINVSSISATVASVNRGDYCISKAGVAMASQLWAARLGEFGIPVYEIRPGLIQTDMTTAVADKYNALIAGGLTIEPRWGQPEDVGKAVAALASGSLPYATGAIIPVDGGLTVNRL